MDSKINAYRLFFQEQKAANVFPMWLKTYWYQKGSVPTQNPSLTINLADIRTMNRSLLQE